MPSSQGLRRIAIALLVPLYVRFTNLFEFAAHVLATVVATIILVKLYNKPFSWDSAIDIGTYLVRSQTVTYLAYYVIVESWKRLILTYVISLDGIGDLSAKDVFVEIRVRYSASTIPIGTLTNISLAMSL